MNIKPFVMTIKLLSKQWGELPLTNEYPGTLEALYFPGAKIRLAQPDSNSYCYFIPEFKVKSFTIRYCFFYSTVKDVLTFITDPPSLTFRLGYSHTHQIFTTNLGKQLFHERSYNISMSPTLLPNILWRLMNGFRKRFAFEPFRQPSVML
jgi:hypothetical protein